MSKEFIRAKQTRAELRNKRRAVKGYIGCGEPVPAELIVKIKDLQKRV